MSIFAKRISRPNQLATLRELEAKVAVGKVSQRLGRPLRPPLATQGSPVAPQHCMQCSNGCTMVGGAAGAGHARGQRSWSDIRPLCTRVAWGPRRHPHPPALQVVWAEHNLAIITGINSDAPLGTKLAFVSGGTGWVWGGGGGTRSACRRDEVTRPVSSSGPPGPARRLPSVRAACCDTRWLCRQGVQRCCCCCMPQPACVRMHAHRRPRRARAALVRCSVLLWHRSDNLAFALTLAGGPVVGEGVECKIKGVLQVGDASIHPPTADASAPHQHACSWKPAGCHRPRHRQRRSTHTSAPTSGGGCRS